jgi:Flp pilus assembly protein TadG
MRLPVIPNAGKREAETRIRAHRRRGNNLIEFSLIVPWYIFLFVGALDSGFFAYSLIASQTAAREGALYCASLGSASPCVDSANSMQCGYALDQLRMMPNVGSALVTCGTSTTVTASAPVAVSTASLTSATTPASPDGNPCASVTIVYLTPNLIPIPGIFPGQVTITRTVKMRYTS